MQKYITLFVVSIFSSLLAVLIFSQLKSPEFVYLNASPDNHKASQVDYNLSGEFKRQFQSSAPTDFILASKKGTETSVFIQSIAPGNTNLQGSSSGSGVIISSDGYIATNNHVIENANEVQVTLDNNKEFMAKVIGMDPNTDLALLKIEAENLKYAVFGNSDSMQVGEWVLAVGSPFRLQSTVTAGIISAKARNINLLENNTGIESFIQTDAAVNPGNSGGALVNTNGELIGINSAIMAYSGKYEGYSFAIPSNLAQKIIYDLKTYGSVQRGWMGISIKDLDQNKADELSIDAVRGIYVIQVNKDQAAYQAGIRSDDVIISLNDNPLKSTPEFMEQVGRYRPGDKIEIEYIRAGKKSKVEVELRNQINTTDFVAVRKDPLLVNMGFELRNLSSEEKERLGKEGVMVVSITRNSTIGNTNMDPGYIITKINKEKVKTVDDIIKIFENENGQIKLEGFYENYPGPFSYLFYLDE